MDSVVKISTKMFFDKPAVMSAMDRAERRALSKLGAFTRTAARRSIRRRKKASQPGKPPSAHAASGSFASLKNILFVYDKSKGSVVVGPVKANQVQTEWVGGLGGGNITVPQIMEEGGVIMIREESLNKGKSWRRRDMRYGAKQWKEYRTRRAVYKPRPYMGPAKDTAIKDVDKAMVDTFY